MEEKKLISNILTLVKGLCNTTYHATIESNEVDFEDNLKNFVKIQRKIYIFMKEKKLYKVEMVEKNKLNKAKEEYCY